MARAMVTTTIATHIYAAVMYHVHAFIFYKLSHLILLATLDGRNDCLHIILMKKQHERG